MIFIGHKRWGSVLFAYVFEFMKRYDALLQRLQARSSGIADLDRNIKAIEGLYKFRRTDEVYAFLRLEPSAIALVSEAHRRIRDHFPECEIFMEILSDPSYPNGKELLISISTSLLPNEAVRELDAFDDEWWLSASTSSTADICIKVEYR
jgi:hypothetical protein